MVQKSDFEPIPDVCQGCAYKPRCKTVGEKRCVRWKRVFPVYWDQTCAALRELCGKKRR